MLTTADVRFEVEPFSHQAPGAPLSESAELLPDFLQDTIAAAVMEEVPDFILGMQDRIPSMAPEINAFACNYVALQGLRLMEMQRAAA